MNSFIIYSLADKNILECIAYSEYDNADRIKEKLIKNSMVRENENQIIVVNFDGDWRDYQIEFLEFLIESSVRDLELSYLKEE